MKFTNQAILATLSAWLTSSTAFHSPSPRRASFRRPASSTSLAAFFEISPDNVASLQSTISSTLTQIQSQLSSVDISLPSPTELESILTTLTTRADSTILTAAAILLTAPLSALALINAPLTNDVSPYPPGTTTYNPQTASEFYSRKPLLVLQRILRLAFLTSQFNAGLLFDWLILGKLLRDEEYTALKRNEPQRASEALTLCTRLGPTFIKLGQALSIRTDLIPEAYALELRSLQDAVPPFDSGEARAVLQREWGASIDSILKDITEEPVASASIGQVYKGSLSDGRQVAVKIQRPGILAEIALDLHVLRVLTPIQTILQNAANGRKTVQEDIDAAISLVDEWGRGFVAETDYRLEAQNTVEFEKAMRKRGLDAVCAPGVVEELTRDKVLVTEWVEGTRLDRDASPDVPRLCGVAINAYLTMLLDTGCLHCGKKFGYIVLCFRSLKCFI
jgi:hypothetical protein